VKEEIIELNRVTTNFASKMQERGQQIEGTLRSFAAAVDAAADRLAATVRPGPAPAAPAGPPAGPAALQLVRVVNDQSTPIPVVMVQDLVTPATKQEPPKTFWDRVVDFVTVGLPSAIGSFAGGLVSGFASTVTGITTPWVGIAAGAELITVLAQVTGLLREVGSTAEAILKAVNETVHTLFDRLTDAGIFPVEKLRDTLLSLLEVGLALVYAQVRPILDWVSKLLTALGTWMGKLVTDLGSWLTSVGNTLTRFFAAMLEYLFDAVVRPKFHVILTDLVTGLIAFGVGLVDALGTVLLEGGKHLWQALAHGFMSWVVDAARDLWLREAGVPIEKIPIPPAPPPFEPRKIVERAFSESRFAVKTLTESLLGEPPAAPGAAPRLRLPAFKQPALELPAAPGEGGETAPAPKPKAAAGVPGTAPVTLNGGVNVQITAETIDLDNAEETARRIAAHVLDELERLTELQRFRRGLPTEALA
jgi:hypothetical protein